MMIYRHHSYIGDGYNDVDILLCGWLRVENVCGDVNQVVQYFKH